MRFAAPAREHHVQIRLAPWDDESQSLLRIALVIEPEAVPVAHYDGFGNLSHHFAVLDAHRELAFSLIAEVETRRENPFDFTAVPPARELAWIADSLHQAPRLWDFVLHQGALTPALPEQVAGRAVPVFREGVPLFQQVQESFDWIHLIADYDPRLEASVVSLPELFDAGRGTASDLAHLLIALMRHWRIPARFVLGYLDAAYFDPDEEQLPGESPRPQVLHHWAEVLIPGGGWRGFDPALRLLADGTYVRAAIGRDANDIQPMRQSCKWDGDLPEMDQTLSVSRID
jgi:transglutaminase-like putative cysteine protease